MKHVLVNTFPAKRGECGLFIFAPIEGLEVLIRAWRPDPASAWRVLPQQADGVSLSQMGRVRVEELLNS